jgi:hypothetical protein
LLGVLEAAGLLRGAGLLEFPNKGPFIIGLVFLGPFGFGGCSGVLSTDLLLGGGATFSQPFVYPTGPVSNILIGNSVDFDISTLTL